MEREIWRPVRFFEKNYSVSNLGRVKSHARNTTSGGIMNPSKQERGYMRVCLHIDGMKYNKFVHRLVLGTFTQRPSWASQVNHIDGNPSNNRLDNLEWSDSSHNQKHALRTGLARIPWKRISEREKIIIANLHKLGRLKPVTQELIARAFGITQSNVSLIVSAVEAKELGEE